jgi:hypothetical protein
MEGLLVGTFNGCVDGETVGIIFGCIVGYLDG